MNGSGRLDAVAWARRLGRGEARAVDLARAVAARVRAVDPDVHAYLAWDEEALVKAAEEADAARAAARAGPFAGLPTAVKDNLTTVDFPTTCGSRILEGYRPPYDATAVRRLRAAGLALVGKTNMDEFAMGSSTEHSAFGPTRNPLAPDRVPGGSSGGSAAAVAAGMCLWALGSDTGGSVRQPAAYCGVVGIKPTYGRVSRYGLVAFASSLDQVGTLTASVRDGAALLDIVAGHDPMDATSAAVPAGGCLAAAEEGLSQGEAAWRGVRVGLVREALGGGVDGAVAARVEEAARALEGAGARLVEVSLPTLDVALSAYYLVATAEASSNLARFDGVRYGLRRQAATAADTHRRSRGAGFGPEVKRRILLGTYALSRGYYDAYYVRAQKARTRVREDLLSALGECDVLVTPTAPDLPFGLGERTADPLAMYAADLLTVPASLAGFPALSVPAGRVDGLPVGMQLMGRPFAEAALVRLGAAWEAMRPWELPVWAEGGEGR
ncbi:MAG: Asp-tRNA(Asn)/Glu-tRNA(Gln) amidotransferase subunit GatA [Firmicutes bacterium]|nr:Asp-tRNA(Asn)/Glu-tRNA(Gln) amidotransferase subunit GatA [Bacillota bacterium]